MRKRAIAITVAFVGWAGLTGAVMASGPAPAGEAKPAAKATETKSGHGKAAETKDGSKKSKENAHVLATSPSYIGIDPIYTTILDGDMVIGTLMLGIGLDVPDQKLHDEVVQNMPRIRDLYVRSMLSYTASGIRPWRQPSAEDIADRLQQATDRHLKRKGVRVLLAQVAMRLNR
ncbi:MAG: hypothetical protein WCD42_07490 [Rhizomicrobium sp.]